MDYQLIRRLEAIKDNQQSAFPMSFDLDKWLLEAIEIAEKAIAETFELRNKLNVAEAKLNDITAIVNKG